MSNGRERAEPAPAAAGAQPMKILIVDDEARNLDVLESLLQSPDYVLVRALTAEQALLRLLADEFAAIVLDIQMPGMSGLELASLIKQRKRTQHIPIIFLTAYFQGDSDIIEGYDSGAVDYLTKPINPQILRSKIGVFVELFRKTRALLESNQSLEIEVAQRQKAEDALRRANDDLEARVRERTVDLSRANRELIEREAALRESEAQARAASCAKDEFLAALSHELRTPLNPVLLVASAAAADPSIPTDVRAMFEMVRKNVELEARLINDLLDLTGSMRGKLLIESNEVDVHAVVRDALAIVRPEIEAKEVAISVELRAAAHRLRGDPVRLQQVFWNLLKNAVKFTPQGGRILVESWTSGEEGQFSVRVTDSGIGLTSDELLQVFEPFAQGEHARENSVRKFGGLGLGLAISRTLVELHGGRIEASSPGRDRGASFSVSLPLNSSGEEPVAPVPARIFAPPSARSRPLRILLIDDHAPTRATLVHLLGRRDYDVVAVGTAAEARAIAGGKHLDLVISDIGLPDASGCDLLRDLRAAQPGVPAIALSGYGMDSDLARTRQAGFSEHLIKPVTMEALDHAIAVVIGNGAVAACEAHELRE